MKFTLIQPPIVKDIAETVLPPLGLLNIATLLQSEDNDCEIIDLNAAGVLDPGLCDESVFHDTVSAWVETTQPDVVGLTSMALDSHIALQIAKDLKSANAEIHTVLGGPHFGAIATDVLNLQVFG